MSRSERLAATLYRTLLVLYPADFRAAFGEEMVWVFTMSLAEAAQRGAWPLTRTILKEITELPAAVLLQHLHERRKKMLQLMAHGFGQDLRLVRWITRLLSLLPVSLYLLIILLNEDVRAEPAPAIIVQGLVALFILGAWRWEREGGTLIMTGAPILFVLFLLSALRFNFSPGLGLLVAGAVALPYLVVGWLFYSIGQHGQLIGDADPASDLEGSGLRRPVLIAGFALLGLAVIFMFGLSFLSAAPQPVVVAEPQACSGNEGVIRSFSAFPVAELPETLPDSLKGYELYSYQKEGAWTFTFQVGLNRLQTSDDSNAPPPIEGTSFTFTGLEELLTALDRLPEGEYVTWCGFERPDEAAIADIEARSQQRGIQLTLPPE